MSTSRRRPGRDLAAMVAVLAAVLVWWLFSGNGPQGPAGNDPLLAVPEVDAEGDGSVVGPPQVVVPGGLRIQGFEVDGQRLTLRYTGPPAECTDLDTPRILETDAAVTVTLSVADPDASCEGDAAAQSVRVLLDSPLQERALLDGSVSPQVRVARGDD